MTTVSDRLKAISLIADWDIKRVTPEMVEFVLSVAKANVDETPQQQEGKKGLLDDHFFPPNTQAEETKLHRSEYINHPQPTANQFAEEQLRRRRQYQREYYHKHKPPVQNEQECPNCHRIFNYRGLPTHLRTCKARTDRTPTTPTGDPGGEAKNAPITAQSFGEFAAKMDAAKRGNTLTFPEKH